MLGVLDEGTPVCVVCVYVTLMQWDSLARGETVEQADRACSCVMWVIMQPDHKPPVFLVLFMQKMMCVFVFVCRTQIISPSTLQPWKMGRENAHMTLPRATLA